MWPIDTLTPIQNAQIEAFFQRWLAVSCATTPIETQQVEQTIQRSYALMGKRQPEILFFSGPLEAQAYLQERRIDQLLNQWGVPLLTLPLVKQLSHQIRSQLRAELLVEISERLKVAELTTLSQNLNLITWTPLAELFAWNTQHIEEDAVPWGEWSPNLWDQLWQQQQTEWRQAIQSQPGGDLLVHVGETLWQWGEPVGQALEEAVIHPFRQQPEIRAWEQGMQQMLTTMGLVGMGWQALTQTFEVLHPALLDYCIEVLECDHEPEAWIQLRSLSTHCGLILPFEQMCVVFDRPIECHADPEGRFHYEGGAALQFADGYRSYQFHGVQIPERYGTVHPHVWKADWLIHEQNAELRRVLIQGIGYDRLCQELQAESLNTWREYTLLRIAPAIDVEPIYLLKMTCPSTGYIHATRVPPSIQSAREAIRWVNWDTDPEEFAQES
ncbi:hypothetical protein ON05_008635 [Acaryochloris sp. CCMEE 5410]|nr:hypothetical protein ON05_008635 [Acaryochloris sp. CCMEE 5410]